MSNEDFESDICFYCEKSIHSQISEFTCGHKICLNCVSIILIKSEFSTIEKEMFCIECPCGKGKFDCHLSQFISLIEESSHSKRCLQHKAHCTDYCVDCKVWICEECTKGFHDKMKFHKLVKEPPKIRRDCILHHFSIEYYCTICKAELCKTCLKEHPKHTQDNEKDKNKEDKSDKNESIIEIEKAAQEKISELRTHKDMLKIDDFKEILGQNEGTYRDELINQYNIRKSKMEKIIKELQQNLQSMKDQIDTEIKFSQYLFKILNFSYSNYIDYINDSTINLKIIDDLLKVKKELKKIEITPSPSPELDSMVHNLQGVLPEQLARCKLIFQKSKGDGNSTLTFHSGHKEFMSLLYKINDDLYATGSVDKTIKIFTFDSVNQNLEVQQELTGHEGSIQCMCSLNDTRIATGSYDNTIKIWNLTSYSLEHTLEGHTSCVKDIKFIPSSIKVKVDKLISCDNGGVIKLWNLDNYTCEQTLTEESFKGFHSIQMIYQNYIAVFGSNKGSLLICHGKTLRKAGIINTCSSEDDSKGVTAMTSLQDQKLVVGNKEGSIIIYDPEKKFEIEKVLKDHTGWVTALLQINEKLIASGGRDELIKIWNLEAGNCIETISGHFNSIVGLYITDHGFLMSGGADGLIKVTKRAFATQDNKKEEK